MLKYKFVTAGLIGGSLAFVACSSEHGADPKAESPADDGNAGPGAEVPGGPAGPRPESPTAGGNPQQGTGATPQDLAGEPVVDQAPGGAAPISPAVGAFTSEPTPIGLPDVQAEDSRQFDAVGSNPFVYVAHDPLSTFAADVDTASYDVFRKDVAAGRLPPPASVRLEEFVNYFSYDYPSPGDDDTQPFSINLAAAPNFIDGGTTLFRVGIQGQTLQDDGRKAMNLVFLVDTSGSMRDADKLPLVQRLLIDSLDLLSPADTVSIVTYAGSTGVALPATEASERDTIETAINAFSAGGSTAGAQGIELAYAEAESAFINGGVNHVILCTDGDFNVGISNTDELVEFIEEKREGGVTFTALGFGSGNLNDATMEAISNAGNGTYSVITDEQHAHDYVTDQLFSSLQFIAKDMKLQVEFNAEHVLAYRLLGYENRAIADDDFRVDTVDAGEIGSGHRVTALYELVLTDGNVPLPAGAIAPLNGEAYTGEVEVAAKDLALVKVRYKDVDASAEDAAYEVNQSLSAGDVATSPKALDADFRWAVAIASFAEILKESPYANPALLEQLTEEFVAQGARDAHREAFVDLFTQAVEMLDLGDTSTAPDGGVSSSPAPDAGTGTEVADAGTGSAVPDEVDGGDSTTDAGR